MGEQRLDRRSGSAPLKPAGLIVQALDCRELLGLAKLGSLHGRFQYADGAIIDLQRDGIGMPILAAVGDRKSRRIAEAVRRAMDDLGNLGQRADGAGADAGHEQKLREIPRPAFGGGRQIAMEASGDDVLGPDIVMGRHDQMRQHELGLRFPTFDKAALELGELPLDPVWPELAKRRR